MPALVGFPGQLKKIQEASCPARCQQIAQAQTWFWVADWLFHVKNREYGGWILSFLSEFHVRKHCSVQDFSLWAIPARSNIMYTYIYIYIYIYQYISIDIYLWSLLGFHNNNIFTNSFKTLVWNADSPFHVLYKK